MILTTFEVLENAHNMGTGIQSFKEYLTINTNRDEEFYVGVMSTFVTKVMSLTDKAGKKQYLHSNPRIRQIQVGWKGRIDIMKSLKDKYMLLEDKKNTTF